MDTIVGNALYVVTNPFEAAGKLAMDPMGVLSTSLGMGLTSFSDVVGKTFDAATIARQSAMTNLPGYGMASLLVMWIFWVGFRSRLGFGAGY